MNSLFREPLIELTVPRARKVLQEIEEQSDEYFEEIPIEEFKEYLISKYSITDFPKLIWEEVFLDFGETEIIGLHLPRTLDISDPYAKHSKNIVEYNIPINGNKSLLNYHVSNIRSKVKNVQLYINKNNLCISFVDMYDQPERVEKSFNSVKNDVISILNYLETDVKKYNQELPDFIQKELNKRVQKINKTNDYKSKFKYPIKKKNVPEAFVSPRIIKKQKITPKPVGGSKNKTGERYISDEDYMYILELLQDCGKNWEQHPEIYKGKGEEALRDYLLFVLAPNINGVVAGEAYNKGGRTDISIKYKSTNLFIGECKIWKGPKVFSDTIDQILNYLTWRDSKAAIMMFVPNQDISSVRAATEKTAMEHSNFVRKLEILNEGWINYRFHIKNDTGTYLKLAVQLYHLPEL